MNDKYDVVIIGAGLSGIGAAYHLQQECPGKSYVILEGRDALGGTWDQFRFPGIRSDSDMHTLGYKFKPWVDKKAIADGPAILNYITETAAENGIDKHIRYGKRVTRATWSSNDAAWTLECTDKANGKTTHFRCNMILTCSGYYSYEQGYTPDFAGRDEFTGRIVHPQDWPDDLDYRDKQVVVIGSGATAVTLIPEMAGIARHVVMLQRSPTYMVSRPDTDAIANFLRAILPGKLAYTIARWKNIRFQQMVYRRTRTNPEKVKNQLLNMLRKELNPDVDIEKHFTPDYNPWDQRLCLVPNSDFFAAINSGKASVVTDHIERFTAHGVRLQSGEELQADIIVTATGLSLVPLGGIEFIVDDKTVDLSKSFSYKAIMYSDVPNLVSTFGYINASWTLRADLIAEYFCRLIKHMEQAGVLQCTPRLRDEDQDMPAQDWITNFSSGYMKRAMHLMPRQGNKDPWINPQNYYLDKILLGNEAFDDGVLHFSNPVKESADAASDRIDDAAA
jgi:cation diffusion facilitator CzcD-associated flavoprotein CzcO